MKQIKKDVIIFDFDGTLADTFNKTVDILHKYSKYSPYEFTKEEIKELIHTKPLQEIIKEFKVKKWQIFLVVFKVRQELKKRLESTLPYTQVKSTIKHLHKQGFELGILTSNKKALVLPFLKEHKLDSYFSHFMYKSSLFGKDKNLTKFIQKYKLEKNNTLYIGDELRDLESCKKINLDCIGVTYGYNSKKLLKQEKSFALIDEFKELENIVIKNEK